MAKKRVPAIVQDYRNPLLRKYGIYFQKKADAQKAQEQAKKNGIRTRLYKVASGWKLSFVK